MPYRMIKTILLSMRQDGHVVYSHRLRPGVNHNSHGLTVAKLAGVPPQAMTTAEKVLKGLDSWSNTDAGVLRAILRDVSRDIDSKEKKAMTSKLSL